MRIRIGFAVTLTLVVVLTLGSTGTSAAPATAPSENAVVYWSGVAEGAIAAGRPPASSTALAAWCTGRCTTLSPPWREASSRSQPE